MLHPKAPLLPLPLGLYQWIGWIFKWYRGALHRTPWDSSPFIPHTRDVWMIQSVTFVWPLIGSIGRLQSFLFNYLELRVGSQHVCNAHENLLNAFQLFLGYSVNVLKLNKAEFYHFDLRAFLCVHLSFSWFTIERKKWLFSCYILCCAHFWTLYAVHIFWTFCAVHIFERFWIKHFSVALLCIRLKRHSALSSKIFRT